MMRKKLLPSLLLVAALLGGNAAWASIFSGLYQAEVPVANQSGAARGSAMADALRQVVVKVSGSSSAADNPALKDALSNPSRYVEQYSYRSNDSQGADLPLLLGVKFDSRGIGQLLKGAGISVWGKTRPLTIVWLVVEQGGQKILVGAHDQGQVRVMLEQAAQRRGLPLRLPMLDATDRALVQPSDAWGDFHNTIMQASQRYEAQAVLIGRLAQVRGGRWQVRWTLYQGGTSQQWSMQSDKVAQLVDFGIDSGVDTLAASYSQDALAGNDGMALHWVVQNVRNLHDYRRLMDYFAARSDITSVQPEVVQGDTIRLSITTSNDEGGLLQVVAMSGILSAVAGATESSPSGLLQPGDRLFRLTP